VVVVVHVLGVVEVVGGAGVGEGGTEKEYGEGRKHAATFPLGHAVVPIIVPFGPSDTGVGHAEFVTPTTPPMFPFPMLTPPFDPISPPVFVTVPAYVPPLALVKLFVVGLLPLNVIAGQAVEVPYIP